MCGKNLIQSEIIKKEIGLGLNHNPEVPLRVVVSDIKILEFQFEQQVITVALLNLNL